MDMSPLNTEMFNSRVMNSRAMKRFMELDKDTCDIRV